MGDFLKKVGLYQREPGISLQEFRRRSRQSVSNLLMRRPPVSVDTRSSRTLPNLFPTTSLGLLICMDPQETTLIMVGTLELALTKPTQGRTYTLAFVNMQWEPCSMAWRTTASSRCLDPPSWSLLTTFALPSVLRPWLSLIVCPTS